MRNGWHDRIQTASRRQHLLATRAAGSTCRPGGWARASPAGFFGAPFQGAE